MGLFSKLHKLVSGIGNWSWLAGPGGVLWAMLTWVSSKLGPIAQYGWPADVLAGVLFTCLLMASCAAILTALSGLNPSSVSRRKTQVSGTQNLAFAQRRNIRFGVVQRDKTLNECIDYIATSTWNEFDEHISGDTKLSLVLDIMLTVRQQALDGSITIWGKKNQLWEVIGSDFWRDNAIKFLAEGNLSLNSPPYFDLMGSKKQFEAIDWQKCRMNASPLTFGEMWVNRVTSLPGEPHQVQAPQLPQSKT